MLRNRRSRIFILISCGWHQGFNACDHTRRSRPRNIRKTTLGVSVWRPLTSRNPRDISPAKIQRSNELTCCWDSVRFAP